MAIVRRISFHEPLVRFTAYSGLLSLLATGLGSLLICRLALHLDGLETLRIVLMAMGAGLVMTVANYLIVRSILRPRIRAFSRFVDQVAKGDLKARLEEGGGDLFGQFGGSLNAMAQGVREIVSQVVGIAHKVSASAESLSASAEQMNASAE
jgi:methyl-accepting chemotaxis protein